MPRLAPVTMAARSGRSGASFGLAVGRARNLVRTAGLRSFSHGATTAVMEQAQAAADGLDIIVVTAVGAAGDPLDDDLVRRIDEDGGRQVAPRALEHLGQPMGLLER